MKGLSKRTEVSLDEASGMLAELRGFTEASVARAVARAPLSFFPHARMNGDGSWRAPMRDVRSLLGGHVDQAVSCATFAGWLECSAKSVTRAVQRGVIRRCPALPAPLPGSVRIPSSEFLRLMHVGGQVDKPRAARFSFFREPVKRGGSA